jgi:hypothetical protein
MAGAWILVKTSLDQLSIARLDVGLIEALDKRLNLGRISFRNVIALGKHRPSQNQIAFTLCRRTDKLSFSAA